MERTYASTPATTTRSPAAPRPAVRAGLAAALTPALLGALLWVAFLSDVARPSRAGGAPADPGAARERVAALAAPAVPR
jgi:hypothetical protein